MRIEYQNASQGTLGRHFERDQLQNDSLMMHVTPFVNLLPLPVGIRTFRETREDGCCYVYMTAHVR